jgi:drug/metabolite transporter (DMT)-like permease
VIGAGLPLAVGVLDGERPGPVAQVAIAVALAAIVCATAGSRGDGAAGTGVLLGLAAGAGFGLFFVGLDATPADSGLWPLLAGRVVSVTLLGALVLGPVLLGRAPAARAGLRLMVVSGLLDTLANVLFLVATRVGTLSVSAVVVSLYPVVLVVLGRIVLGERLTRLQLAGTGLAVTASVLLASG